MEALDYEKLADKIAERLSRTATDPLWTSAECADYLKVSTKHFTDRISKRSDFPKSIRGSKRWLRSRVMKWAEGK